MPLKCTGRFLAEITKQVLSDLEASKYQVSCPCGIRFFLIDVCYVNAFLYILKIFRWLSTGSQFMEENRVNGISWQVGLLTMLFIVRMLSG